MSVSSTHGWEVGEWLGSPSVIWLETEMKADSGGIESGPSKPSPPQPHPKPSAIVVCPAAMFPSSEIVP